MSLLMEALRKAEAAKNKKAGEDDTPSSKLSLEEIEPGPPQPSAQEKQQDTNDIGVYQGPDKNETISPPPSLGSLRLELEEMDVAGETPGDHISSGYEAPDEDGEGGEDGEDGENLEDDDLLGSRDKLHDMPAFGSYDAALSFSASPAPQINEDDILEHMDARSGGADELHGYFPDTDAEESPAAEEIDIPAEQARYETLQAAAELGEYERSKIRQPKSETSPDQARLNRQTAHSLFQAKQQGNNPRRTMLGLLVVLVALFPIGGGVYWYYTSNLRSSDLFPGAALTTAPQGFIEDAAPAVNTPVPTNPESAPVLADAAAAVAEPETELREPAVRDQPPPAESVGDTAPAPVVQQPAAPVIQPDQPAAPQAAEQEAAFQFTRTSQQAQINPDLLAAYESYQQNDFAQAQRLYTQVLDVQPNNRDALLGLAIINRQQGNVSQTRILYTRLLQLNPRDPLARAGLLESSQNGSPAQQESELRVLRESYPDVAPLAFAMGNLYASQSRWNEAQNAYFDALVIAADSNDGFVSPDYAFNLAVSLERLNQLQLAYTYYLQARDLSATAPAGFSMQSLNQRLDYLQRVLE